MFAIVFGLTAGIAAELIYNQSLGGFFATLFTNASVTDLWASVLMCTMFGAIIAVVCCYKGMTASGGAAGVGRAVNQAVVIAFVSVFFFQLRRHLDPARDQPGAADDPVIGWLDTPRGWLDSFGEIARFGSRVAGQRLLWPGLQLLRRGAPPGRHPDPRLGPDHLGLRPHPRPAVRDPGRLLLPRPGRALATPACSRPSATCARRCPTPSATSSRPRSGPGSSPRSGRCGSPTRSTRWK